MSRCASSSSPRVLESTSANAWYLRGFRERSPMDDMIDLAHLIDEEIQPQPCDSADVHVNPKTFKIEMSATIAEDEHHTMQILGDKIRATSTARSPSAQWRTCARAADNGTLTIRSAQ